VFHASVPAVVVAAVAVLVHVRNSSLTVPLLRYTAPVPVAATTPKVPSLLYPGGHPAIVDSQNQKASLGSLATGWGRLELSDGDSSGALVWFSPATTERNVDAAPHLHQCTFPRQYPGIEMRWRLFQNLSWYPVETKAQTCKWRYV
jgi:hypothetical protein